MYVEKIKRFVKEQRLKFIDLEPKLPYDLIATRNFHTKVLVSVAKGVF